MTEKEIAYLLSLAQVIPMNQKYITKLMESFGSAEAAWKGESDWDQVLSVPKDTLEKLREHKRGVEPEVVDAYRRKIGAKITTVWDDDFPEALTQVSNPPFFLYYFGSFPDPDRLILAVVGARKFTDYGRDTTDRFVAELVERANVQIVNGMAEGVDGTALKATLRVGGHATAVLGTGLDVIYPAMHRRLYGELKEKGCIFTEYPFGMQGIRHNFPARNRLVTGISHGVLVTEARRRSGTIHSVEHSLEQGKNVYAIPGPIYSPLSELSHYLIKSGQGKFTVEVDDILEDYIDPETLKSFAPPKRLDAGSLASNRGERSVITALQAGRRSFDELMEVSDLTSAQLTAFLTRLELEDMLREAPGNTYMLINQ